MKKSIPVQVVQYLQAIYWMVRVAKLIQSLWRGGC